MNEIKSIQQYKNYMNSIGKTAFKLKIHNSHQIKSDETFAQKPIHGIKKFEEITQKSRSILSFGCMNIFNQQETMSIENLYGSAVIKFSHCGEVFLINSKITLDELLSSNILESHPGYFIVFPLGRVVDFINSCFGE